MTSAVVLAAGSSRRLGHPKQTLAFGPITVLGATLDVVRSSALDQRIVTLGGAGAEVRATVDLGGFDVVEVEDHGEGCAASIVAAVDRVDPEAEGFVLLLGDQPGMDPAVIESLIAFVGERPTPPDAVITRYDDGLGHPMWLGRRCFGDLRELHGDKAVWKLLESGKVEVLDHPVPARIIPLDVDTWDDYLALCRAEGVEPTSPAPVR